MSAPRSSYAWIITAHALAGAAIGGLEGARLGPPLLVLALVPLFALTGLVAGAVIAIAERSVEDRRPLVAAAAIAAPSLIVTVPVAATLFRGAYAQTLPLAPLLPYLAPVAGWLAIAALVWGGRRLADGDLTMRAIAIVGTAGALGGVVWVERHVLGSGYADAQSAAAVAVIVLVGVVLRLALRLSFGAYVAAAIASLVLGTALASLTEGLDDPTARQVLADRGDHGKDLVRMWRDLLDFDRDGSSALLGGGDCDDRDTARHPGAIDVPGDGIDQDCDGADAVAVVAPPAPAPAVTQLAPWRDSAAVRDVLARTRGMNVLVITVDALRFDPLAPGAPHRDDFPRLAKLLDESVLFVRAFSPASGTDVALSALMTGRLDPYQPIETTLAEAMHASGRRTSMAIPEEVSRHVGSVLLTRGFDTQRSVYTDWDTADIGDHVSAGATTAEGLRAFDKAPGTWFAWLHYFDVHEHHQIKVPAEMRQQVWSGGDDKTHDYRALLGGIDRAVGKLLDDLERRGMLDKTIIVFASDHGESLGEDARFGITHGQVAYTPLVHIPIAFRIPGVTPGVRTDLVTLRDVTPTLLELVGAPGAIHPIDGFDLVPAILDGPRELRPPADRGLVIHEELQWSVIEWPYQLVMRVADDLVELYDLEHDPRDTVDLATRYPVITKRLRARYAEAPVVHIDRSVAGRAWREQQAQPPPPRARP